MAAGGSGIVAAAFLFGVVVIMAAGSGALLEQMTGLYMDRQRPVHAGGGAGGSAGCDGDGQCLFGADPVLVLATLAFAAAACIKFGTGNIFRLENVNTNP